MKNLALILICMYSYGAYAQNEWPLDPMPSQHQILGTIGEYRNTNRFHRGIDMLNKNESDLNVYAIYGGKVFHNGITEAANAILTIGAILYVHVKLDPRLTNGMTVSQGELIGTMIEETGWSTHLHLQNADYNFLNHHLDPFKDNEPPKIHSVDFRKNGCDLNTNTPQFSTQIPINGENHTLIFNKVDIIADIHGPGVNSDGSARTKNKLVPYSISYEINNYLNNSVDGAPVKNFEFEEYPADNLNASKVFGKGTSQSSPFYYILTSHPSTAPVDRYWNTGLRIGITDTWPDNITLDARSNDEAQYPDGAYSLHIEAKDIKFDADPPLVTQKTERVLVDNFRPYVRK
ncbi:MAG: hypothetical protein IPL42_09645 [Saprospiraceae bacterium]|nr:hypothetical protein [Saprospiraceae bacterium]